MARELLARPSSRRIAWPCLLLVVLAGYVVGGLVSFHLLRVIDYGATVFPPAGLMVGVLVLSARRRWPMLVAVGLVAEISVDLWRLPADASAVTAGGMVAANTLGPVVAAAVMLALAGGRPPDLARPRGLLHFVAAAAVGSLLSAVIGAGTAWSDGGTFVLTLLQWWLGTSLGIVLVGGLILARVASPDRRSLWSAEGIAMLILVPTVIGWLYHQTNLPLGFTIVLGLMPAAVRFGTRSVTLLAGLLAVVVMATVSRADVLLDGLAPPISLVLFKLQMEVHALAALLLAAEVVRREEAVARAQQEHQTVLQLQQALLPPRELAGPSFRAEGVYQAASERVGVGGDWYDVVELADGRVFVCVGDVVGHGAAAVVAMGQLRFALGAIAGLGEAPGGILTRLDEAARRIEGASYATVWVATFDPERGELAYSSAGHPPALLGLGDQVCWLDQARSVPIGMTVAGPRPTATVAVPGPASILLFTDGTVERRGESLDVGFSRLARAVRDQRTERSVGDILTQVRDPAGRDDSVLLRVELTPATVAAVPANDHGRALGPGRPGRVR